MPLTRTDPEKRSGQPLPISMPGYYIYELCPTCNESIARNRMIAHVEKGCVPRSTSAAGATLSELAAAAAPKPATTTTSAAAAATASASAPVAAVASTPAAAARASTGTVRATEPQLESRMYSQAVALRAQRMNKALQRLRDASDEVTPRDLMFLKHIIKERLSAPATASLLSDEHQVCPRSRGNLALCAYRLTCTCTCCCVARLLLPSIHRMRRPA